jgi:hypothetical protein
MEMDKVVRVVLTVVSKHDDGGGGGGRGGRMPTTTPVARAPVKSVQLVFQTISHNHPKIWFVSFGALNSLKYISIRLLATIRALLGVHGATQEGSGTVLPEVGE